MRRNSFLLVIGFLFLWGLLSSFDYAGEWGTVRDLMQSQPKSALEKINAIEKRAKREKNAPQEIACILQRGVARSFIDDSSFVDCLAELKKYRQKTKDEVARSVATYLEGALYLNYYNSNYGRIYRRTELIDTIPEDIAEWTPNLFVNKIRECVFEALSNEKLKSTPSSEYGAILKLGFDSRLYRPTLYDFFVSDIFFQDRISIFSNEEKEKYWEESAASHEKDHNLDAYVKAKLDLLYYKYYYKFGYYSYRNIKERDPNRRKRNEQYVAELKSLLNEVRNEQASILVRVDLCNALLKEDRSISHWPKDSKLPQQLKTICEEGIKAFPHHKKISVLEELLSDMNLERLSISLVSDFLTTGKVKVRVDYANVEQVRLNLSRLDVASSYDFHRLRKSEFSRLQGCPEFKNDTTFPLQSFLVDLPKSNYCIPRDTVLELPPLDFGIYRLWAEADSIPDDSLVFEVSNLFCLRNSRVKPGTDWKVGSFVEMNYVVVDAKSGAPIPNVKFDSYFGDPLKPESNTSESSMDRLEGKVKIKTEQQTTDSQGFASFEISVPISCRSNKIQTFFETGKDRFSPPDKSGLSELLYGNKYERSRDNGGIDAAVFTDRAIYRPSQTVYYKVICYELDENGDSLWTHAKLRVSVSEENSEMEMASDTVQTNEFGSASSSFVLPEDAKLGRYRIDVFVYDDGYEEIYRNYDAFRVEEYKRPSFELKMTPPSGSFSFGDTIKVKGTVAYLMGVPLAGREVKYRVEGTTYNYWTGSLSSESDIAEGTCVVAGDGSFSFPFVAKQEEGTGGEAVYSRYAISARVTDANGETSEEKITFTVGSYSLFFSELPKVVQLKDFPKMCCGVTNQNREGVALPVSYEVSRMGTMVASGKVNSDAKGKFVIPENTEKWLSGRYRLTLKSVDEKGREVAASFDMILFSGRDKRPPVDTIFWHEQVEDVELSYGEPYTVRVGSSLKDAHLLMIVSDKQSNYVEKRWSELNDEIKDFTFRLTKKNGDFLNVLFLLVRDGKIYEKKIKITKKKENKVLPIQLSVFRNKLVSGSKETWTVSLPKGKPAELLVAMYDASLDQISGATNEYDEYSIYKTNQWCFSPVYVSYYPYSAWIASNVERERRHIGLPLYYTDNIDASSANWKFDHLLDLPNGSMKTVRPFEASSGVYQSHSDRTGAVAHNEDLFEGREEEGMVVAYAVTKRVFNVPILRKDFSETAFFYPQLRTDKEGRVRFSFVVPDCLTRWKFKALAHTKDLHYGQIEEEVVTQKEFMISPNLPRFLRGGDRCVLSAKVVSLSESVVEGTAVLEFLDPETERVIDKRQTKFSVAATKNGSVTWAFDVPRDRNAVLVRTSAVADNFSDAEQSLLPILSDRTVLTQSLPLYVRGGQTKNYTFENLVNNHSTTLSSRFLKLEFAKDPIWYAVQALPSVATVEWENAVSYSAAHFAALLSKHLALSNPKIFQVIDSWKKQGADKQTLLSNLEKNKAVKNILLKETPWVMEANDEREEKQRLAALFDVNDLQGNCNLWFEKLKDFRRWTDGYSWHKMSYPSIHTTLFVLDNFGRLRKAGIMNDSLLKEAGYSTSLHYLDEQLRAEYEVLKQYHPKEMKEYAYVGMYELYYFQVRSLFPEVKMYDGNKEAFSFYYDLAKDRWMTFPLYGKALAAIAFYRNGDQELAKQVVNSLREFSKTTDEMGMFWPSNTSGCLWSESAISTHTRIMEALELIDPKVQEQDELRLWLLNQKRTQNWGNPIANVDALNVLLLSGTDWLSNDNQVTIKLGGKTLQQDSVEAGTGYFTEYIKGDEVKPSLGHVELKSEAGGNLSWGALYWQFEEDIDKVVKNKTALHVEKMVMLEVQENGKPILKQINEGTKLSVGDKLVVRLTLRTDRDMDYVSLKDQRASCLEPTQQLSGYRCGDGTCYYQSPKDAAMYYFFDHLAKGTYVFEYPLWVTHAGDYCNGITTAQCLYAPEFLTNTGSVRIRVETGK